MPLNADKTVFYQSLRVADYECDMHGRMRLSDILRHMQVISARHLDALGYPYPRLAQLGQVFLLSKILLTIHRRPSGGETLKLTTSPKTPVGAQFIRCNDFYDAQENCILHADTAWILVDPKTRRVLRPRALPFSLPLSSSDTAAEAAKWKPPVPPVLQPALEHTVRISDLDINHHMNNAHYADIFCNALSPDLWLSREPSFFYLHYQNEALLNDKISLFSAPLEGQSYYVCGKKDTILCFEGMVTFNE